MQLKSKKRTVSSDLRLLGRVVLAMRTRTGKQDCYLNEFLKVKYFDDDDVDELEFNDASTLLGH